MQPIRQFLRSLFASRNSTRQEVERINIRRAELTQLTDNELWEAGRNAKDLDEIIAATAVAAARILGLHMFDVQLQGALALANGRVAEMQTGEGKTLAAVPAIVWYA